MRKHTAMISSLVLLFAAESFGQPGDAWSAAAANGADARIALEFCGRYANGWLSHAAPETGLLPRRLNGDHVWNARDCAADNLPFLAIYAHLFGNRGMTAAVAEIMKTERRVCPRLGSLPDTVDIHAGGFIQERVDREELIFGASEYAKDGLMPMTEMLGKGPWLDRMEEMMRDIWAEASASGPPSPVDEVNGNLMQVMSRLYWLRRNPEFKHKIYRIADYYLLENPLLSREKVPLRDHGCEVLGGLSEAYLIAAAEDAEKHGAYRAPMHALMDSVIGAAAFEDGMLPNAYNPRTGERVNPAFSDSWGYVYDAVCTVGMADGHAPYLDAARRAVENIHRHLGTDWEKGSADGYADSVEGALNLMNRFPDAAAAEWVDQSVRHILSKQGEDGIIEGWYGDGNSARTMMMYALWKTRGARVTPWRGDLALGAAHDGAERLCIILSAKWDWEGTLCLDSRRHLENFGLPMDYPRINQFPEWVAVVPGEKYRLTVNGGPEKELDGGDLRAFPLSVSAGETLRITLSPIPAPAKGAAHNEDNWRRLKLPPQSTPEGLESWQNTLRGELAGVLKLGDLPASKPSAVSLSKSRKNGFTVEEVVLQGGRREGVRLLKAAVEANATTPLPAVICIPGHGGAPEDLFKPEGIYKNMAGELAKSGYVVLAASVGYHEPKGPSGTLMGGRISDLMTVVDYAAGLAGVDPARIGCAGLSLGGEMAMWLGAMDTRVRAVLSAGFLTSMNQMERNHCMCWEVPGLRELADFPDIYALVAPRPLMCQIGLKEPLDQFNPTTARHAFDTVRSAYAIMSVPGMAELDLHGGAHEIDLDGLLRFFGGRL